MKNGIFTFFICVLLSLSTLSGLVAGNSPDGYRNESVVLTLQDIESDKIEISNAYPNPASEFVAFNYKLAPEVSSADVTVYNLLGSVIGKYDLDSFEQTLRIDVSNLQAGIYFYTVTVDNQNIKTKKFLVKK